MSIIDCTLALQHDGRPHALPSSWLTTYTVQIDLIASDISGMGLLYPFRPHDRYSMFNCILQLLADPL
jgi:hypothetical protein